MRSTLLRESRSGSTAINMTPMIDITFLLLTFFTLSSHFASAEKVEIALPRPDHSQAVNQRFPDKVILNLVYQGAGAPAALKLGAFDLNTTEQLDQYLSPVARHNPLTPVILRADRRLSYGQVRRVMEAVSAVGLSRLQVVTELGNS